MRIALITPGFSADPSDWCIPALLNLVRRLAVSHEVHVFTTRYPHRRGTYDVYGATVHAFDGRQKPVTRVAGALFRAARAIVAGHRPARFDVIHGLWAGEAGLMAAGLGRLLGVPSVVSLMGGELENLAALGYGGARTVRGRARVNTALRLADAVTAGSAALAARAREVTACAPVVLPLGVDREFFSGAGEAENLAGEVPLLCVASLVPVKDHDGLLRALASANSPALHLHLVGGGPLRGDLETLAGELGIGPRVSFHGDLAHDRLPAYYRGAAACVLASRFESQALVAAEAAACGRVTVGTAVGCLPDLSGDSLCAAPGDVPALAAILERVAGDPAWRDEAAGKAEAATRARYDLNTQAGALVGLYEGLA